MSTYGTKNHNAGIHLLGKRSGCGRIPGMGPSTCKKISDDQVRELRIRYLRKHEKLEDLAIEYGLALGYAKQIVEYRRRLNPACDI